MRSAYKFCYILACVFYCIFHPIRQTGRENIPDGAVVVCANHTSLQDPLVLAFAMGREHFVRFMAKEELMRIPVLGGIFKSCGVFGVKRGQADIKAIKTALSVLKGGDKLGIFPEGHRVLSGEDADAKSGAVMLAMKTGSPILPVYIPADKSLFKTINVVIGKPYYIEKIKGGSEAYAVYADELMQKIEELKP